MVTRFRRIALAGLAVALVPLVANAHCVVGARFFPATLSVDDPCVADELSLPTIASFKNGDDPSTREVDIAAEYLQADHRQVRHLDRDRLDAASAASGESRVTGFRTSRRVSSVSFSTEPAREFVMSGALDVEFGHTGNGRSAPSRSAPHADTLCRSGSWRLPDNMSMARPFALTGQIGYAIPSKSSTTRRSRQRVGRTELNPRFLTYGGSLQYSMPYLKSNVVDLGLPEFFDHLIPIVESQLQTPVADYQEHGDRDDRNRHAGRHLDRKVLPGRRRGDHPDQSRQRHRGRRTRATAPLPG